MTTNKKYKCVFFDLDHTLWDYETNAEEALKDLYNKYELDALGAIPFHEFYVAFTNINNTIWDQYDRGEIHRDVIRFDRFHRVFKFSGIDNYNLSLEFSEAYIHESPKKGNLVPYAKEILNYLHGKYPMHIITNGFDEIQSTKMASSGITNYFNSVVTSARAGSRKPQKEIFEFALAENGFAAADTIMIGDNLLTDIAGARNASVDNVFFNPNKIVHSDNVTYEIHSLKELQNIL